MTSKKALKCIIVGTNVDTHRSSIGEIDKAISLIEKDLEVLEILKNKLVDITILYFSTCIEVYNCGFANRPKFQLTQEEYNKIKEWLKKWNIKQTATYTSMRTD